MEFVEPALPAVAGTVFIAAVAAWVYSTLPKSFLVHLELHGRFRGLGERLRRPPRGNAPVSAFDGLQRQPA